MSALTLSREGWSVTLLERSGDSGRTGAALHADRQLLHRLTGQRTPAAEVTDGIQSWTAVHTALRAAVEADPAVQLHDATRIVSVGQDDHAAWARSADGTEFRGDVVVGADGHRSVVRRAVDPARPEARYAGYVIWIGVAEEHVLAPGHRYPGGTAFLDGGPYTLLGYSLPGQDGSIAAGQRRIGWAWYDAGHNDVLRATGSVRGDIVHHSLTGPDIPEETFADLERAARRHWAGPWLDAIVDCIARRAVIGTPIAEYVPDRLVNGRVALVGDAAHVPTPMTGSGFSASEQDAEALSAALGTPSGTTDVEQALRDYERSRLSSARRLVQSGQGFSRSFAQHR